MPDYQDDLLKDIADTKRAQGVALGAAQKRKPIKKASEGWVLPSRDTPDPPEDGGHIYANNAGEPYWVKSNGTIYDLSPQEIPVADPVDIAANMTAGATAPGSYSQDYTERLRDDVREVRAQFNALINSLRAAGLLDT